MGVAEASTAAHSAVQAPCSVSCTLLAGARLDGRARVGDTPGCNMLPGALARVDAVALRAAATVWSATQTRRTGRTVPGALLTSSMSSSSTSSASAANWFCVCTAAGPQATGELATNLPFPTRCKSPGSCGTGVAAAGPCPLRLPPPDRQHRPRGLTAGVVSSTSETYAGATFLGAADPAGPVISLVQPFASMVPSVSMPS